MKEHERLTTVLHADTSLFAVLMIGICVENTRKLIEAERREKSETDCSEECVYTTPFSAKNRRPFIHFGHSFT